MNNRLSIVVGHNSRAKGAVNVDGVSEYEWNQSLARMIAALGGKDGIDVRVHLRKPGSAYWKEIDRVYAEVNAFDPACSIELHFNGATNHRANGCATLSSGSKQSMKLATQVQSEMLRVMGGPDDGVLTVSRSDRGGRSLWAARCPAILTEPFFGSNHAEVRHAEANKNALSLAVYTGAKRFMTGA